METSNRFKNLIDPIRDIASNWDIDIADELSNYLEELEEIKISFDGGSTNLNFAEAALVISGSTAIYSKKVEYLYQLVMKTLEYVTTQVLANNTKVTGNKQKSVHISIAEDERLLFSNDLSTLLVDDVVEEANNIDLEDIVPKDSGKKINNLLAHKNDETKSADYSRSSVLLMNSILQDDQGGGSLKMSSCRMDATGVLMLGNLPALELPSNHINISMNVSMHQPEQHIDNFYDNNDQDFGYPDQDARSYDNMHDSPIAKVSSVKEVLNNSTDKSDDFIRSNLVSVKRQNARSEISRVKSVKSIALLDPHVETHDSRPVKKGVCYKIPKKLQANESTASVNDYQASMRKYVDHLVKRGKHTGSSWDIDKWFSSTTKNSMPSTGFLLQSFSSISKKSRRVGSRNEHIGDDDLEDEFIYRDPVDDHDYELNIQKSRTLKNSPSSSVRPPIDPVSSLNLQDAQEYHQEDNDWGDNDNGFENDNALQPTSDFHGEDVDIPNIDSGNAGFGISEEEEEEILAKRVDKILNEELNSSLTSSYKLICDKMIMDFKRGLEQYARETNLSRRVADWTSRIEPILLQQELGPVYDIHDYSDRILVKVNHLSSKHNSKQIEKQASEVFKFEDVVVGKTHSSEEVCRSFLACLQLANMGNILVVPPTHESSEGSSLGKGGKKGNILSVKQLVSAEGTYNLSFGVKLLDNAKKIDIENYSMAH